MRLLDERAKWAHNGDESGLEWRLMPKVRVTAAGAGRPSGDEFMRRHEAGGTPLYQLDLPHRGLAGLYAANLVTVEEVAARSEDDVRLIDGVGPKSLERLREALKELGLAFEAAGDAHAPHPASVRHIRPVEDNR
jgi:DNA-directed RNA polymerase alpha subunit